MITQTYSSLGEQLVRSLSDITRAAEKPNQASINIFPPNISH